MVRSPSRRASVAVADQLKLTTPAGSIEAWSPLGAAAVLAQAVDLHRFTAPARVVKQARLAPRIACRALSPAVPGSATPAASA